MNQLITMETIARRALANLYNSTVLAALVHRDYDESFTGKKGDTVNVRVPIVFEADRFNRADGIQIQDAEEDTFPVILDEIADVSFAVTSEELTLNIDEFDERFLTPAMEAIIQMVDGDLALAAANASAQVADPGGDYVARQTGGGVVESPDATHPAKVLIAARTKLGRNKLPTLNRFAVVSPEAAGELLGDSLFHQADQRGDTDGLIEAAIGRKFGFDTYETQVLGEGASVGDIDGVAFHRDAVALATRTLEKPKGVAPDQAAVANYKGLGMRVVYDYDIVHKQDVVSVDFLYGVRAVRPQGAVELELGQGS